MAFKMKEWSAFTHTKEEAGYPHENPHYKDQKVKKDILGRTKVKTTSPSGSVTKEVYKENPAGRVDLIKKKTKHSRKMKKLFKQKKEGVSMWVRDKPVYPKGHKKYKKWMEKHQWKYEK